MNQGDQGDDRSEECLMMKNLNFPNNLPYLTQANLIHQSARGTKKNRRIKSAEESEEPPVKIMHHNIPHLRMRMILHQRLVEVNGDRKRNPLFHAPIREENLAGEVKKKTGGHATKKEWLKDKKT